MQGLIGKKLGMTQVFDESGRRVAVTVLEVGPCVVIQRKTRENDGYDAVQVGFQEQKPHRVSKPAMGRFTKANSVPMSFLREFAVEGEEELNPGDTVKADLFEGVTHVDVTGVTKGRGFQGVVKRFRAGGGRMTHGGHSRRRVGSIGQCSYPANVAKNQIMPGHMGHVKVTQQNLRVVQLRGEENLLLVKGAVPGPTGGVVVVKKALKKKAVKA